MDCVSTQESPSVVVLPDLPDYEIHSDGRVFRVHPYRPGEVKAFDNRRGYLVVRLRVNGIRGTYKVHRLVCRAFHGDPPVYGEDEAHCRHLDGDRLNNRAENLRWGTKTENERDKRRFYGSFFDGERRRH
jgi:hypothetical protein